MDQSAAALIQQQELLREIRDELRSSRSISSAAASGSPVAGAGASGAGFMARAQAMSDRVLAGEFASFGWTQALQPIYRQSAVGDIGGALGITRSPSILTQPEFQALSTENLSIRAQNFVGGVIAPGYTSRTSALADEIFANSPRFMRFGSSSSALGVGMNRLGARSLARQINYEALGDMRLSPTDYSSIATVGMQTGQFDNLASPGEFMNRLRELAAATADVTRTLRMSAEEASKTLGSLRGLGITDIGVQRSTLMGVGAAAQVAGMTTAEMMGLATGAGAMGVGMGLSGQSSMLGVARLAAQMREATQSGVVDKYIMARGGGAAAVAQNIFAAEAGFATSDAGYLSFLGAQGGRQGGFLDSLVGGVQGVTSGGMYGVLRSQRARAEITSTMSDADRQRGMRSFIEQQAGMLGISDMNSAEARDIAFSVARGALGMDENAAIAYTNANFSADGRRASDRARLNTFRAQDMMDKKLAQDSLFTYSSFGGRFARARAGMEQAWAGVADTAAGWFTPGASGFGIDMLSGVAQQARASAAGLTPQQASLLSLGRAATAQTTVADQLQIYDPIGGAAGAIGGVIGGIGLGVVGGFAGAPLGPLGVVGVGAIGSYVGTWLGEGIGNAIAGGGGKSMTVRGAEAKAYSEMARSLGRTNILAGRKTIASGKMAGSATFRSIMARKADMGQMDAEASVGLANDLQQVARELGPGTTVAEVADALVATGVNVKVADAFGLAGAAPGDAFKEGLKDLLGGKADTDVNFFISENADALKKFLSNMDKPGGQEFMEARVSMSSMGLSAKQIDAIAENYKSMSSADKSGLIKMAGQQAEFGASQQFFDIMGGVSGLADALIGEGIDKRESGARDVKTQFDNLMSQGDRKLLFQEVTGDTALGSFLRKSKHGQVFRDAYDAIRTDLGSMSAEEISKKFNLDQTQAVTIKQQIASGADPKQMAAGLAATMFDVGMSKAEDEGVDREREIARNLREASVILRDLKNAVPKTGTDKEVK